MSLCLFLKNERLDRSDRGMGHRSLPCSVAGFPNFWWATSFFSVPALSRTFWGIYFPAFTMMSQRIFPLDNLFMFRSKYEPVNILLLADPGKTNFLNQNFNSNFRAECLSSDLFSTLSLRWLALSSVLPFASPFTTVSKRRPHHREIATNLHCVRPFGDRRPADAIKSFDGGIRQVTGNQSTAAIFATYPSDYITVFGACLDQVRRGVASGKRRRVENCIACAGLVNVALADAGRGGFVHRNRYDHRSTQSHSHIHAASLGWMWVESIILQNYQRR